MGAGRTKFVQDTVSASPMMARAQSSRWMQRSSMINRSCLWHRTAPRRERMRECPKSRGGECACARARVCIGSGPYAVFKASRRCRSQCNLDRPPPIDPISTSTCTRKIITNKQTAEKKKKKKKHVLGKVRLVGIHIVRCTEGQMAKER